MNGRTVDTTALAWERRRQDAQRRREALGRYVQELERRREDSNAAALLGAAVLAGLSCGFAFGIAVELFEWLRR